MLLNANIKVLSKFFPFTYMSKQIKSQIYILFLEDYNTGYCTTLLTNEIFDCKF